MKRFRDFDLTDYNSYKVKSYCRTAFFPECELDIVDLYKSNKDYIVLGSGNNVILSKSYYDSDFIIFNGNFNEVKVNKESNEIIAEAGAEIYDVSKLAKESELTGAEFYYDIPSSVGGAVVMNAGTKEGETKNILAKVRYLDLEDMLVKEKSKKEIEFEYRNSFFQKQVDKIILKAWFNLKKGNYNEISNLMSESKKRRWEKQPRNYPNAGSVFKRPPNRYVGPMIDELGLKGYRVGGAEVSKKHSGFIINRGDATGNDILNLINEVKHRVFEKYNVNLEIEQRII
ncbi:UDP-N-acetylmuramate dehydrogenase [Winogradskyella sp.]|uniref:UDP-N-acetylmuramate dehydrogenase n=1 Tax=Winogradskyella sp. TaxID=1883156 RepID=UPI0025EC190F|nr:UDP-N-acetylmuramate dehydrogenase [Winogradskyella sp.]MCT4630853.1 UDP-N-acetylmuramate dehydrogenase [Winogradskyella sp.]